MDEVLRGLHFAYTYIDDVLITSSTPGPVKNTEVERERTGSINCYL